MAYAYTDPTSINYILQRAHTELRRGENQHYRSTEAQYTNHVKELLGNLERYLETCGVRLPTQVQEGAEITATAEAAGETESERTPFSAPPRGRLVATQRVNQGRRLSSGSAFASVTVGSAKCDSNAVNRHEEASNNISVYSSGPVRSGWGKLATPCEAQRGSGAANACHVASSCPVAAATSTLHGIFLKHDQVNAMSDSSSSPLGAAYQQHIAPDNRCVRAVTSESEASILYKSQQATTAHAAYSSSSSSVAVDAGADANAEGSTTSLLHSGDAAGVDSCSVDSGSAPIVAIIDSGCGGGNSTRSRGRGESVAMRSPPAPPQLPDHYTGEGARGGLYASGDSFSRSTSTHLMVLNAIASASCVSDADAGAACTAAAHDRWGEFGTFVQSITESRQNSNLASLRSAAAAGCPLPDGVNGAPVAPLPAPMRNAENGSSGAVSAPLAVVAPPPGVDPMVGLQLPSLPSTGTSMTTPPAPVSSAAAGRQVQPSPLHSSGAKITTSSLTLQVAHGAGSSAVRALAAAGVAAEAGGSSEMPNAELDKPLSPSFGILSSPPLIAPVPQFECIPCPPLHSGPGRPAYFTAVVAPMQRVASEPLASHRLCGGGGDGTDSIVHHQQAQRGPVPPHPGTSADAVAATAATATTASTRNPEKAQLMCRLREVLERSVFGKSSVQPPAVPSAVAAGRRSSLSDNAASGVGENQEKHSAAGSTRVPVSSLVPSPQSLRQNQQMPGYPTPLPSTTKTDDTPGGSANAQRSDSPSELKDGDKRGDGTGGVAWDDSWDFLRLATAAISEFPHTTSSKDIVSEAATSHSVPRGTVRPKDAGGDEDRGSMGPPRCDHAPKEGCRAHGYVGSSNKAATMNAARPPGGLSVCRRWDMGSCATANNTSSRAYAKEMVAASLVANAQQYRPSLPVPMLWMRPARSPPGIALQGASVSDGYRTGLTKSNVDNFSRAEEEVPRARQRHSAGGKRVLGDEQQPSQDDDGERQSFSTNLSPAHAEKQQLMQRLRMVLSRHGE
ncbi:hypothetical protein LMJF_35_0800 [Leishmania major strain Friedlin]|uniref:Uncharacterized protein n=1 Tax=Leishmania major TaxID=5664 RepID=E9AEQ5_LEIMA|nr:hypothetical protein LMJF_35_0800 [Leishmania major strain Friedlin]CAG9582431.1 hypothetical_protein_-_conserved [Leishmania major strain Friedlin]CBZ12708.1 hypothetical protein LMJF_35_0800 [Leishmania major strain Friedlin]|eukprot:XP_003722475.1 hypothetical protein LMJF_35_0800 [Leishmania major strain Friedlin]